MVDQPNVPPRDRTHLVDLFAGPGGLDVAAHWLGLRVDGVEWDSDACLTRAAAGLSTKQADVRTLDPERHYKTAGILAGGPPCQTYTVAGSGAGRRALAQVKNFAMRMEYGQEDVDDLSKVADERTALVLEPLRWILKAFRANRPFETIVLEQVPTVRPVWEDYRGILERLGYSAKCGVLNTEEFGVPQTRRRAILIASWEREVHLPRPTHARYRKGFAPSKGADGEELKPWVSMGEALHERPLPFEVVSNYGTGGDPKKRGRRDSSLPAATVTGKVLRNRLFVDGEDAGRFSFGEAGRLQTFPLDYPWAGKDIAQQIGNAIPPRLAVHVLAAALALPVDDDALDRAVDGEWKRTSEEKPLAVAGQTSPGAIRPRRTRSTLSAAATSA